MTSIYRNDKYLNFIRGKGCVICGDEKVDAHHVGVSGIGIKISDYRTVPLCRIHHAEYHSLGGNRFGRKYNINLDEKILSFLEEYINNYVNGNPLNSEIVVVLNVDSYASGLEGYIKDMINYSGNNFNLIVSGNDSGNFVTDIEITSRIESMSYHIDPITPYQAVNFCGYDYLFYFNGYMPVDNSWVSRSIELLRILNRDFVVFTMNNTISDLFYSHKDFEKCNNFVIRCLQFRKNIEEKNRFSGVTFPIKVMSIK